jgi:sugar lactone lactonase YvrE
MRITIQSVKRIATLVSTFILLSSAGFPAMVAHADAVATPIAGQPGDGPLVNDIPATSAQFWNPSAVITTKDGTTFVADTNHNEVRSIGADGIIHAAIGDGIAACSTGSTQTRLASVYGMASDTADDIFVSTACGEVVEFTPGNPVGTVVAGKFDGQGNPYPLTHDGTVATDITFLPTHLTYDKMTDTLYIYDTGTNRVLQLSNGLLSVAAGNGSIGFSGDGGPATSAQFSFVRGIFFANGNLYISDTGNCRVRTVDSAGVITTIVGDGTCIDQNVNGPGTSMSMQYPGPMTIDDNDMLYIGGSLSGTVYAYDTGAKTIAPVVGIISNNTGLAMDKDGNLLALHSGVNQQLYRITGLPVPVPPADGKQHGRVTDVTWGMSATTPLWNMEVTVKTATVSCPAVAVVNMGGWQKRTNLCGTGQTGPKSTTFNWKVFNDTHSLTPGSSPVVSAFVAKSDAAHYGTASTTLSVPSAPTLVGVGDSYISGYHQTADDLACLRPSGAPSTDTSCGLIVNDPDFSWVTKLADKLNLKAPVAWHYDYNKYLNLLAQGGATTPQIDEQIAGMQTILQQHPHTWNVVAFDGGGNDVGLQAVLHDYYVEHLHDNVLVKPWDIKLSADCPNSETAYQNLFGATDGSGLESTIQSNLRAIITAGKGTTGTPRFVDMLYPYITKATNVCSKDATLGTFPTTVWHGSASVINGLNDVHRSLAAGDVLTLDLANSFGDNPLPKIQQIRYYGYPHPNDAGQDKIAQQAFKLLK